MVRRFVEKLAPFTEQEWIEFWARMDLVEFKKHQSLLKVGEVENYLDFLVSGIARLFIPMQRKSTPSVSIFPEAFSLPTPLF